MTDDQSCQFDIPVLDLSYHSHCSCFLCECNMTAYAHGILSNCLSNVKAPVKSPIP